jgi:tRNA U34 5-carboxymethylaminomethyl modifying GTPase MnmE/TrmE
MNELSKKNQLSETLRRQNVELEKELLKANGNDLIASVHQENIALRHEVKKISEEILAYQRELRILQNQNTKLLSKHQNEQQNHSHLSEEPEEAIDQISNLIEDGNSSQINLSGRCILIVGGLFKMETLYRHLIEENGGIFEYHDGEMNAGIKKLENQVRRADLVLCPLNYNSHAASSVTKRLCKKYQKPLRMLANSSLSTISLTLSSLQNSLSEIQDDQDELSQQIV